MTTAIEPYAAYPTLNPVTIEDGVIKTTFLLYREGSKVPNALVSLSYRVAAHDAVVAIGMGDDEYLARCVCDGIDKKRVDEIRRIDGTPIDPATEAAKAAEFQVECRAVYAEFSKNVHAVVDALKKHYV